MSTRIKFLFYRAFNLQCNESVAFIGGFLVLYLVFSSYFMLRPVRETFGIAGGIDHLSWLFTATFASTILIIPLFGYINQRIAKIRLFAFCYIFCAFVMLCFALSLYLNPANIWAGRLFFIWTSVYNLFVISLAWSFLAQVFTKDQAQRLFGPLSAGASLGGLSGPLLTASLVQYVGQSGLLLISTGLFLLTLFCSSFLIRWGKSYGRHNEEADKQENKSLGIWVGLRLVLSSPYMRQIALYIILISAANTFLYFAQARLVSAAFTDRAEQTQVFSIIDAIVQGSSIIIQIFFTGRIAKKLGVTVLLVSLPILMIFLFGLLGLFYSFPVLVVAMVCRRVGEYALVRPGREMLFAAVDDETRFTAKNTLDTFVYRGADAIWGWVDTLLRNISHPQIIMGFALVLSGFWALTGKIIGRHHDEFPEKNER